MKPATLDRKEFTKPRLADFATAVELTHQVGHDQSNWDQVILKELIDNTLDASERAGVKPEIVIVATDTEISISDSGPGISPETVKNILNYSQKTSSSAAYVSPTRGQQGNAFQTLLAMQHAATGKPGVTTIESRGLRHTITFATDRVTQEPAVAHAVAPSARHEGTSVRLNWRSNPGRVRSMVNDFVVVNPHASFTLDCGARLDTLEALAPGWRKWLPSDPTSPHWYDEQAMRNLMAAEVRHAPRTLADFLSEFRGLKSTAKRRDICEALYANRISLAEFLERGDVRTLLLLMRRDSQLVKPRDLGVIGEAALMTRLGGIERRYKRVEIEDDGIPYLAEVGFAHRPGKACSAIFAGVNYTASVLGNPFDDLGGNGLNAILADQYCDDDEPIAFALHLATPKPEFTDRGKSSITLPATVDEAIAEAVRSVTKAWARQRKAEDRNANARLRRRASDDRPMSQKEAAELVMAQAYMAAGDNGTLPANARQIFYAARPEMTRLTGGEIKDSYFTQTLMPDYVTAHPDNCADWNVVYDERGHFAELHTGREIGLGTLAVRDYLDGYGEADFIEAAFGGAKVATNGPDGRYSAVIFCEKEGFAPLFEEARIAERYDVAIMSTKGLSNVASRMLLDQTCARYGIPLLVMHDFDPSGFSILGTPHKDGRRYEFQTQFKVIDIGLRLEDVERLGLQSEPFAFGKISEEALRDRLIINGATDPEADYLLTGDTRTQGKRVELNAMTSRQFVDLVEEKLTEHGIGKVIPDIARLDDAFCLFARREKAKKIADAALAATASEPVEPPADLDEQVRGYLEDHPAESWDQAVAAICSEE